MSSDNEQDDLNFLLPIRLPLCSSRVLIEQIGCLKIQSSLQYRKPIDIER